APVAGAVQALPRPDDGGRGRRRLRRDAQVARRAPGVVRGQGAARAGPRVAAARRRASARAAGDAPLHGPLAHDADRPLRRVVEAAAERPPPSRPGPAARVGALAVLPGVARDPGQPPLPVPAPRLLRARVRARTGAARRVPSMIDYLRIADRMWPVLNR